MLLRNVEHHPQKLNQDKINAKFSDLDKVFLRLDQTRVEDNQSNIECDLLQEQPPNLTDISKNVIEMIKTAETNIRIIQPYV